MRHQPIIRKDERHGIGSLLRRKDDRAPGAERPAIPRFARGTGRHRQLTPAELAEGYDPTATLRRHDPALDAIPHAVFVIGGDGRIADANALGGTLVGYLPGELVGELMDLVVTSPASAHGARLDVGFVAAGPDVFAHHSSGHHVPVELVLCPHGRGATMAIVHRVTAGTRDEDGLREKDVEQIVHDLRAPLTTIAMETFLLDEQLAAGEQPDDLRSSVARIARNVTFLERMTQNLLDSCAISSNRLGINRQPTELRTLLVRTVERVSPRDRGRVTLDAPEASTLAIDELKIERVVANLLTNALKYAPPRSPIVIRLEPSLGGARISVTDVGPGMTAGEMTHVFDKYHRTDAARAYTGSGLGLYVSKQIVVAHGGRIGVEADGGGSRFFLDLAAT